MSFRSPPLVRKMTMARDAEPYGGWRFGEKWTPGKDGKTVIAPDLPVAATPIEHPAAKFKPPQNARATFFGCPREIRDIVYGYLFVHQSTLDILNIIQEDREVNPGCGLLVTCRQIYDEAQGMARSNVLVIPKPDSTIGPDSSSQHSSTFDNMLPLNYNQKLRFLRSKSYAVGITTIIIREKLRNICSYWPRRDLERHKRLEYLKQLSGLTTVFVQLCICEDIPLLYPRRDWTGKLADTLKYMLVDYAHISRIIIYYCGLHDPIPEGSFGQILDTTQMGRPQQFTLEIAERFEEDTGFTTELISHSWSFHKVAGRDDRFQLRIAYAEVVRTVELEFHNSNAVCEKKCVLD